MQSAFAKNNKKIIRVKFRTLDDVKKFVDLTGELTSDILVYSGHYEVDGRSLMGILSLSLSHSVDVKVVDDTEREVFTEQMKELGIFLNVDEF